MLGNVCDTLLPLQYDLPRCACGATIWAVHPKTFDHPQPPSGALCTGVLVVLCALCPPPVHFSHSARHFSGAHQSIF